ncbi:hypothetical protein GUJ93_ZPchr0002g24688 [Zizania palustris]|uniref:Secreted protein n=1 Tax=Zizania palustris TaxID=103762 RepID=A0A8J5RVV2_ZIZPA|nr:hypothetical protein GUJ93_ZPchr0002g24688 [Zizania palustris]
MRHLPLVFGLMIFVYRAIELRFISWQHQGIAIEATENGHNSLSSKETNYSIQDEKLPARHVTNFGPFIKLKKGKHL